MSKETKPEAMPDKALEAAVGGWNLGSATLATQVPDTADSRDGYANLEVSHMLQSRDRAKG